MTDNTRHLVVEMSIGMLFYTVVLAVLAVVFKGGMARMGFSTGPVLAGLFCAYITERAADSMDEGYANKSTVIQSMIRRVVFIIVLFVLGSRPQIDAVAMIIGALGLKAGALCQPIVHRTFFSGR